MSDLCSQLTKESSEDLDTSRIREWRSIVTLIVFFVTNLVVLLPFHIPIFVPRPLSNTFLDALSALRVISPRKDRLWPVGGDPQAGRVTRFVKLQFPMNYVTTPLVADLFLLAILAIGREEVYQGTIGANNISPIDIMVFFITLAYIAISVDASGIIRHLAFKVLQKSGDVGHNLFFYLYAFFFGLGTFLGNDPVILTGTAFLAYMTRVSSNIQDPRAWIYSQFAVANIGSAILVSSNPTNLVLAGAFNIRFVSYTANMIVPVVATALVLFPFLLYIIFANETLIPLSIKMHELPAEIANRDPVNPNIPNVRRNVDEQNDDPTIHEEIQLLSLEEIMNPFVDRGGAIVGAIIMAATLITVLALNAASQSEGEHPVFWVTLPAAFVMFCWDVGSGWINRVETRRIAQCGRAAIEDEDRARQSARDHEREGNTEFTSASAREAPPQDRSSSHVDENIRPTDIVSRPSAGNPGHGPAPRILASQVGEGLTLVLTPPHETSATMPIMTDDNPQDSQNSTISASSLFDKQEPGGADHHSPHGELSRTEIGMELGDMKTVAAEFVACQKSHRHLPKRPTLVSHVADTYRWLQETFPTVTAVLAHLPFALVPFAFSMFVLVQALVTRGWVPVFAYGWDHWVGKTGTIGSIGGMAFLSVVLCNFAGTNIGTTILLSRVIQAWQLIHCKDGLPISDRTFWGAVYAMALGVNYGAFSTAFSASLAGLLWRDVLKRKYIYVGSLEFARVNLPIIAVAMVVGSSVLIGEVYIMRTDLPYDE